MGFGSFLLRTFILPHTSIGAKDLNGFDGLTSNWNLGLVSFVWQNTYIFPQVKIGSKTQKSGCATSMNKYLIPKAKIYSF